MRLIGPARALVAALLLGCSDADSALSQSDETVATAAEPMTRLALGDPTAREAQQLLLAGRPWRARRLLDPMLRDSAQRTPEVLFIAAEAAAALEEWERVERLLGTTDWGDSLFGARAQVLLTHAALERDADSLASERAARAVAMAPTAIDRGWGLVLLARARDRLDHRDSARAAYADAADLLPSIADWLHLRAAGVTSDPGARGAHYDRVRLPVARERVAWTEAVARERTGALESAARAYDSLDVPASALRVRRMMTVGDSTARAAVRREIVELIGARRGSSHARAAVELLDAMGARTPAEELLVARSAQGSGPLARAAEGYARAFATGLGTSVDRFDYATVLSRLGRHRQAAAQFARVTAPTELAAAATYQRGRSLVRTGDIGSARTVLRRLLRDHPADTSAAWAMLLLSDLATDEGRDDAARTTYLTLARDFQRMELAGIARFRAAIIALAAGRTRQAAAELDTLRARYPESPEVLAAGYWSGRAWAALGDSAGARGRWRSVIAASPLSYYSAVSARRLGEAPWSPPQARDTSVHHAGVDSAMMRATLLERLGMGMEAQQEYDFLVAAAEADPSRVLATGQSFVRHGLPWRASRLASRMFGKVSPADARLYRLAYPLLEREAIAAEASSASVDPALVAALIRQESSFNPRATSAAGARGLMQVMPAVGEQIARSRRIPEWSAALLYEPEVSLELGTRHLAASLAQYDDLARALAAYNAGGSRVARWSRKAGADDPELFIERIPFVETRDYVRIVMRNRDLYRALYSW